MERSISDDGTVNFAMDASEAYAQIVNTLTDGEIQRISVRALKQIAKIDTQGKTAGGVIALDALADIEKLEKATKQIECQCAICVAKRQEQEGQNG